MEIISNFFNKTVTSFDIKGIRIEPTYWQAGAIIILIFILTLTLARLRYIYVNWSLGKGAISFLFYGFLLALILEGFLFLSGRTFMTEILGWENPPKPIASVIDAGRQKIIDVLGSQVTVPESSAKVKVDSDYIIDAYYSLNETDAFKTRSAICR